jgi:hypothetical protein
MKRLWAFGLVVTLGMGVAVINGGCFEEQPLTTTTTRETTTTGPVLMAPPPPPIITRQATTTTTYGSPDGTVTRETTYTSP